MGRVSRCRNLWTDCIAVVRIAATVVAPGMYGAVGADTDLIFLRLSRLWYFIAVDVTSATTRSNSPVGQLPHYPRRLYSDLCAEFQADFFGGCIGWDFDGQSSTGSEFACGGRHLGGVLWQGAVSSSSVWVVVEHQQHVLPGKGNSAQPFRKAQFRDCRTKTGFFPYCFLSSIVQDLPVFVRSEVAHCEPPLCSQRAPSRHDILVLRSRLRHGIDLSRGWSDIGSLHRHRRCHHCRSYTLQRRRTSRRLTKSKSTTTSSTTRWWRSDGIDLRLQCRITGTRQPITHLARINRRFAQGDSSVVHLTRKFRDLLDR